MKIEKITVLLRRGFEDHIFMDTDLPPTHTAIKHDKISLKLITQQNYGLEYVRTNFPNIPIEIINGDIGNIRMDE